MNLKKLILKCIPDSVCYLIAKKTKNPKILEILSEYDDWYMRATVAENSYTSLETLKRLAMDYHWLVRNSALDNPNSTEEVFLAWRAWRSCYYGKLKNLPYFRNLIV